MALVIVDISPSVSTMAAAELVLLGGGIEEDVVEEVDELEVEVGVGVDECFVFEWLVLVLVVEGGVHDDVDVVVGATHSLVVVGGGGGGVELVVGFGFGLIVGNAMIGGVDEVVGAAAPLPKFQAP